MVMDTLGIDVGALDSANMKTFKRMTMDTKKFTYEEAVVWLVTLSKISDCGGLGECAETYAQQLVVDEERKQGRMWLETPTEFWDFMKPIHYMVVLTPGEVSYGGSNLPTPPVATGASGLPA